MLAFKINMFRETYQYNVVAYSIVEHKEDGNMFDTTAKTRYLVYHNGSRYDLYEAGRKISIDGEKVFREDFIFSDVSIDKCRIFVKSFDRKRKIEKILDGS